MYEPADIKNLHLEMTTRCNAACPMCPRNLSGGSDNPNMPDAELSLADVKQIFPREFLKQLRHIYLCGVYGDAMVARDTLEAFEYFRCTNPDLRLGLYTNGGGRTTQWWTKLASLVDYCQFGIDGLGDTNHLYRRRTDWQKVMSSAAAFIGAGGKAYWEFIVFRHNEHQIDDAQRLSEAMGFERFSIRKTSRFLKAGVFRSHHAVMNARGETEYYLEPPSREDLRNPGVSQLEDIVARGTSYSDYLNLTEISCSAVADKTLFVSAEGLAFPCCYTAHIYPNAAPPEEHEVLRTLRRCGGKAAIDARARPLGEIIRGPFFQRAIPQSWKSNSAADGRLAVCAANCGKCEPVNAQYGPNLLQPQPSQRTSQNRWTRLYRRLTSSQSHRSVATTPRYSYCFSVPFNAMFALR